MRVKFVKTTAVCRLDGWDGVTPPPTCKKFAYQTNWLAPIIIIIRRHNSGNVAFDKSVVCMYVPM